MWATDSGDGGVDNDGFAATDARFVRMAGVRRGTVFGYSLSTFIGARRNPCRSRAEDRTAQFSDKELKEF